MMTYFKINGEKVEKYKVTFNAADVERIKQEIINNCSDIVHRSYESDYEPSFTNDDIIRNYEEKPIGFKEYFEETRAVSMFSYDKLIPPYLVKLIDKLLEGNVSALEKILSYPVSRKISIDESISKVTKELESEICIENKLLKLEELKQLLKQKQLNSGKKSLEKYYEELISLIKFELIDNVSLELLNEILQVLEIKIVVNGGISIEYETVNESSKQYKKK